MTSLPHQFIPILKITMLSNEINKQFLYELCSQYGNISRFKSLPTQPNIIYVAYQTVEQMKFAFQELQQNQLLLISKP